MSRTKQEHSASQRGWQLSTLALPVIRSYSEPMAFLRTLFWIVVTVIVVVFSFRNWSPVTISLFGDMEADVKLPVLLLIAFLIGFVPLYIWHRVFRWRHARKLAAIDRGPAPVIVTQAPPAYAQTPAPAATADPFKAD